MGTTTSPVLSYRDLKVWERSVDLTVECHALAKRLSRKSAGALAGQLERAAISIPSNIAEGNGRRTRADYLRHLSVANGSLLELETQLVLLERMELLGSGDLARAFQLASEVGRLLNGLIRKLKSTGIAS
jgi:four helix bundle protein